MPAERRSGTCHHAHPLHRHYHDDYSYYTTVKEGGPPAVAGAGWPQTNKRARGVRMQPILPIILGTFTGFGGGFRVPEGGRRLTCFGLGPFGGAHQPPRGLVAAVAGLLVETVPASCTQYNDTESTFLSGFFAKLQ